MTKKPTVKSISDFASSKGGKLLSTKYIDNNRDLGWECSKGHLWLAKWKNIRNGTWCPICDTEDSKCKIETLQAHAISKGDLLLSTEYDKAKKLLSWLCDKGHCWSANWNNISTGRWCPECSRFKTELTCKTLLEAKLDIIFKKTRFKYNNTMYEFDGYNEEHKIAFEYHGIQHYEYPNYWHKTEKDFKAAQQRDKNKEQYCKENSITLLVIPYTEEKELPLFISRNLIFNYQKSL